MVQKPLCFVLMTFCMKSAGGVIHEPMFERLVLRDIVRSATCA